MKETIQVNKIFSNYNIDMNKYEKIIFLARKEISLYSYTSKLHMGKNYLFKRSIELIKAINSTSNETYNKTMDSLPNYDHRLNNNINTTLEKQIFINNFVFPDNEQFINTLKINNIKLEHIENLNDSIIEQKKNSKYTNDYKLNIKDVCNLDGICTYYNFNNREIIINKILELYNLQYDLLSSIQNKKR